MKTQTALCCNSNAMRISQLTSLCCCRLVLPHSCQHAVEATLKGTQFGFQETLEVVVGKVWTPLAPDIDFVFAWLMHAGIRAGAAVHLAGVHLIRLGLWVGLGRHLPQGRARVAGGAMTAASSTWPERKASWRSSRVVCRHRILQVLPNFNHNL